MPASLAALAGGLGLAAAWQLGRPAFAVSGALMLLDWPWTVSAMLPSNRRLGVSSGGDAATDARSPLDRWNRLHAVRTVLGALAVGAFLLAPEG